MCWAWQWGRTACRAEVLNVSVVRARGPFSISTSITSAPACPRPPAPALQATTHGGSGWAWVQPFAPSLWLALGITLLVVPVAVFLLELLSLKHHVSRGDWGPGLQESFVSRGCRAWRALLC